MTLVRTSVDSWVNEAATAKNYGPSVELSLNGGAGSNDRRAFLHFARPFPLGAQVISATLRVYTRGAWASSQDVTAKRVTASWAEARVTWGNQPAVSVTNAATEAANSLGAGVAIELDVTAIMQDAANGSAFYGFRLELSANVTRALHSAEATNANLRPVLEVEWSQPPDAPTGLSPAGGRAVSADLPILAWVFTDPGGGMEQASYEVEIDNDTTFASPLYDSGKTAGTLTSLDLSATAYGGLAEDEVVYWRVRVWDATDLVSAWSETVSFTRKSKGTVAIVSPTGGTTEDLSPVIDWTFDVTQETYQVFVLRLDDHVTVWGSGRVTSSVTTVTVPEGKIVSGPTYLVTVRAWDEEDREAIWGDPDYVEDSETFTYARSGAPDAVTSLTATPGAGGTESIGPGVELEWARADEPDFFCLVVDGVEVLPRILPEDVFLTAGVFGLVYWGATPGVAHVYEVEAVVLSAGVLEHSNGNDTDTATTNPIGIWLVDPDDNTAVSLGGQDSVDIGIGESGTTYYPTGSRTPVRVTDSVRGYEGAVSGALFGKADRDTFLELKGRLTTLRFVLADLNIPVRLEDAKASPTTRYGDRLFAGSFGFFQDGELTFEADA